MTRATLAVILLSIPSLLQGSVTRFFDGNPADVDPPLRGHSLTPEWKRLPLHLVAAPA
ncbi:MAG TPA: hypothetical protein VM557_13320 [Thermoanaerobaculia bacterium]|nr:hypothetical protein [Thermoanaerobaculia bacterium]